MLYSTKFTPDRLGALTLSCSLLVASNAEVMTLDCYEGMRHFEGVIPHK